MTETKTLKEQIFDFVCKLSTQEMASCNSPTVFEAGERGAAEATRLLLAEMERWKQEKVKQESQDEDGDAVWLQGVISAVFHMQQWSKTLVEK